MKTRHLLPPASLALALAFSLQPSALLAQGSLTPPGAPAPTMKTLAQIEPRTPVGSATTPGDTASAFTITQPGSYYLTTNVIGVSGKNGIGIATDDVTLDLNGFALLGVTNSRRGVAVMAPCTNICVRNGTIRGWGMLGMSMLSGRGCSYRDLQFASNAGGLEAGPGSLVNGCIAVWNSDVGISVSVGSVIAACTAWGNTSHGMVGHDSAVLMHDCCSAENGGDGFHGATSTSFKRCFARENGSHGFRADTGSTFIECVASLNATNGILARARSYVLNNDCANNGKAGIAMEADASRVQGNTVTGNTGAGIAVSGTVNLIIQNSARGNTGGNFDIVSGNRVGIIVVPTLSGAITGNGPGAGLGTTDPWANFAF